jgi:ABC-type multidrug transport system fused ATPase/permease subunit
MSATYPADKPITILGIYSEFYKKNKLYIATYFTQLLMLPIRDIGIPHLIGKAVKNIEKKKSLAMPVFLMFVSTVFIHVVHNIIEYLEIGLSAKFYEFVRKLVVSYVFKQNDNNFSEIETGRLLSQMMRLPYSMNNFINTWKYTYVPYIVLSIIAVVYFTMINMQLGISLLVMLIFCWLSLYYSISKCYKYAYTGEEGIISLIEHVDDIVKNMSTVMIHNKTDEEIDEMRKYEEIYQNNLKDSLTCSLRIRFFVTPIIIIYFMVFIYICYNGIENKTISAGPFISLLLIIFRIFNSIWDLTSYLTVDIERWGMLRKTIRIFDELKRNTPTYQGSNESIIKSGFLFKNVSFEYENKQSKKVRLFNDFNLHIPKGQKLAIIGQIGSGKSTLLKMILKQYVPATGIIYYQGIPYSLITTSQIRDIIGYIPQNAILLNRTIYDNIVYGNEQISKKQIEDMIDKLELRDIFSSFKKGLDTSVGKYGSNLSGGQRQIITILRTILKDPEVILMDEPTSSIDEKTKHHVYELIQKLIENKTVIIVTHDEFLLKYVDRYIVLEKGTIIDDRKTTSTFSNYGNN